LLGTPDVVTVGVQHFAGKPVSRSKLVRATLSAGWHALSAALGDLRWQRPDAAKLAQ
jgi:hypothetical protein